MKRFLLATTTALTLWAQTKAQTAETYSYSVKQCIEYAFANSSKVKNAELDQEIAEAKVKEVMGIGLPQINASADLKYFINIPTSIFPDVFTPAIYGSFAKENLISQQRAQQVISDAASKPGNPVQFGTKYNATAGFEASQLIFDGSYFLGLKASMVYKDLSKISTSRTKQEAAMAVTKAYYSVLVNQERQGLLDANLVRLKKLHDDTKAMYDNGIVEKLDYDRVLLTYSNLLVEQKKVEQYVGLSFLLLKFQMGMDMNTQLTLTDKLADYTSPDNNVPAQKIDYTKRSEYNLAKTQNQLVKMDLTRNKLTMLPSLVAYASATGNSLQNEFKEVYNTNNHWYPTTLVGAKLTLPIWGSGQRYYRIKQAKLAYEKSNNDMKTIEQGIDLEVKSASTNYINSIATLESQKKNLALGEDVYKTAKLKYDEGVGSNLEVINAEASLKEAQTNYYSALYDVLIAKVDLDKATGSIKY